MKMINKLFHIFDTKDKLAFFGVFLVSFASATLETLGITMLLPYIQLIMDEKSITTNKVLKYFYQALHVSSTQNFVILLTFAVLSVFVFKNLFLIFSSYIQIKYNFRVRQKITAKIMVSKIYKPYIYYTTKNSSEIIRSVTGDVDRLFNLMSNGLSFLAEILVVIMVSVTLLVVDPVITVIIIGVLAACLLLILLLFRKKARFYGETAREQNAYTIQVLNQMIGGLKEIKVLNRERYFVNEFNASVAKQLFADKRQGVLTAVPKYFIEMASVSTVLGVVLFRLFQGGSLTSLIPTLSVFAMAALRLLPSANRINSQISSIIYLQSSVDDIYEDLQEIKNDNEYIDNLELARKVKKEEINSSQNKDVIDNKNDIVIKELSFSYPANHELVLNKISCEIPVGKATALIGPSGAGKTTLVDIILGLFEPTSGAIYFEGKKIDGSDRQWADRIGYIPQNIYLSDCSIRENVAYGIEKDKIDDDKVWNALRYAQLEEFIRSSDEGLDGTVGDRGVRLSGGQRQRIGIARALYHNPSILILDEATSALDNDTENAVMEAIDKLAGEKTIIIIAHRLSTIKNCDVVYEIKGGKLKRVE